MRLVLASASPARLAILRRAGIEPEVIVSGIDESAVTAPSTRQLVSRLANFKANAVSESLPRPHLVLGCDSMLEFDGEALGKPASADEAIGRWRRMRGRSGVLHTGHCLNGPDSNSLTTVSTTVRFADITDAEIERYCRSGEPTQVAGAFTLDGLGGWFIDRVEGDALNVIGLSLRTLRIMLAGQGIALADLGWAAPDQ